MHNYSFHSKNLIQYDLLSQFTQSNFYLTPKLKKIVLNFGIKEINFKNLILVASALEVVTTQKAILTTSSKSNIFLKIRKGAPVGCRVDLRKNSMSTFFAKFITVVLPNIKLFDGIKVKKGRAQVKFFSFSLYDLLIFPELEVQYELFQNAPKLDISIVTSANDFKELYTLLTGSRFLLK